MAERIAIVDGIRTPMAKAGTDLKDISADELGTFAVKELLERIGLDRTIIDEVILGNVAQPANAANIARVVALKSMIPIHVPAYTVHRNCASGMESITTAASKIRAGDGEVYVVGGTESMTKIPFLYSEEMKGFFTKLQRSKTLKQRLGTLSSFKFSYLKPEIAVVQGLTDPISNLIMGDTAEVLAREFSISREEQDRFALNSHTKANTATMNKIFDDEIVAIPTDSQNGTLLSNDTAPRKHISIEDLQKLRPYFDRKNGTVTVGNACPLTDGAAALVVMKESRAKEMGLKVLGYLREYAYASLEPERMGLGPIYATAKLLKKTQANMNDFSVVELNEAFAAQVLANVKAFSSKEFAQKYLNQEHSVGELREDILNVNGGAIALGHPVGTTGARIVLHVLKELHRRKKNTGLATLCVGGGQGASLMLEVS